MTRRSLSLALLTVALFGLSTVPVVEGVEKRDGEFGQTGRQDRAETEHLVRHFTVTIDQGPSAGLAVFGLLTIEVELNRGTFTGTLTPAEDATIGQRLTSVMFRSEGGTRVPDPNVTQIQVRGSIDGHTLSMVMLDVGGPGKHIFGVGTTENDPGRRLRHDPGLVGGPAVGPQAGDRGDWLLTDGGGGGATPPPSTGTGAFYASNDTFFVITPFSGDVVVTQLTLPAGNYIVMGKVQAAAPPNFIIFPSFQVVCFLAIDITVGHGDVGVVAAASGVLRRRSRGVQARARADRKDRGLAGQHHRRLLRHRRADRRAAFLTAWREHKLKGVIMGLTAPAGNAATRIEVYATKNGVYSSGVVPEIEDLFQHQAHEPDRKKREAMLYQIQQIMHDRVLHVPIYEPALLWGIGPRVEEACVDWIKGYAFTAPYEDLKIKPR